MDNKSDFFSVTKYGKDLLVPTNMHLVLCDECRHGITWALFHVTNPKYIKYGTLNWKLALNAPERSMDKSSGPSSQVEYPT
jgi:hypothetical protein